jgi:YD repeat-containing protein
MSSSWAWVTTSALLRTYNSKGAWDGDNADNWRIGYYRRVAGLAGTVNTAGSSVKRVDADGFESTFNINNALTQYIGKDGAGAYDTLTFSAGVWTFVDGDTGATETYLETAVGSGTFGLSQVTDVEGHATKIAYDAAGLITTIATWKQGAGSADETITLTYDNATNKRLMQIATSYKNEAGATVVRTRVRYEYDTSGRLQYVRTDLSPEDNSIADGRTYWVRYGYDASGRVNSIVQTDGSALAITYDAPGRISTWTDALNRTTRIDYDTANKKTTITDSLNQATVMTYNAADRLVEISGAATGGAALKQSFGYELNGSLSSTTNPQNQLTQYEYNLNGALNAAPTPSATSSSAATTCRTGWSRKRSTACPIPMAPAPAPLRVRRSRATSTTPPAASGACASRSARRPHHRIHLQHARPAQRLHDLHQQSLHPGHEPTLAQLTTWASGLSVADRAAAERREYAYDLRGQLVSVKDYPAATVSASTVVYGTATEQRYVYDAFGRLLQSIDATGNSSAYVYDGLGRLTLAQDARGAITQYQYDDAGMRTLIRRPIDDSERVEVYDAAGALISVLEGMSRQQAFSRSFAAAASADYSGLDMPASGVRSCRSPARCRAT